MAEHEPFVPTNDNRLILHIDMDAFYCSVEVARLGLNPEQPAAVSQWGALIAVNYAARAAGIKKQDNVRNAKQLCPYINLIHVETIIPRAQRHKPRNPNKKPDRNTDKVTLKRYRDASREVFKIFHEFIPKQFVEKMSLDEAYLDVTNIVDTHNVVENDELLNIDKDWKVVGEIDVMNERHRRFVIAANIANEIRKSISERLNYPCSAGISFNKSLAKLASGMKKPNCQSIIVHEAVAEIMRTVPIDKFCGFGGKFGKRVMQFGYTFACQVWEVKLEVLKQQFGDKEAEFLRNFSIGVDPTPVIMSSPPKSIMSAKSFPQHTKLTTQQFKYWVDLLCEELYDRAEEHNQEFQEAPASLSVVINGQWSAMLNSVPRQTATAQIPPHISIEGLQIVAADLISDQLQMPLAGKPGCDDMNVSLFSLHVSLGRFYDISGKKVAPPITSFFQKGNGKSLHEMVEEAELRRPKPPPPTIPQLNNNIPKSPPPRPSLSDIFTFPPAKKVIDSMGLPPSDAHTTQRKKRRRPRDVTDFISKMSSSGNNTSASTNKNYQPTMTTSIAPNKKRRKPIDVTDYISNMAESSTIDIDDSDDENDFDISNNPILMSRADTSTNSSTSSRSKAVITMDLADDDDEEEEECLEIMNCDKINQHDNNAARVEIIDEDDMMVDEDDDINIEKNNKVEIIDDNSDNDDVSDDSDLEIIEPPPKELDIVSLLSSPASSISPPTSQYSQSIYSQNSIQQQQFRLSQESSSTTTKNNLNLYNPLLSQ